MWDSQPVLGSWVQSGGQGIGCCSLLLGVSGWLGFSQLSWGRGAPGFPCGLSLAEWRPRGPPQLDAGSGAAVACSYVGVMWGPSLSASLRQAADNKQAFSRQLLTVASHTAQCALPGGGMTPSQLL